MDAEHIKKKYERLYRLAFRLRHYQIRFKKYGMSVDEKAAHRAAYELDKILTSEEDLKKSLLQELF